MALLMTQGERNDLADAIGDTPETVIGTHLLRRGLADAHVFGDRRRPDGAIVQSHSLRSEPWCLGTDPAAVLDLLRPLNDWRRQGMSPNVDARLAPPLAALAEKDLHVKVEFYGDVYHTLSVPVADVSVPEVRQLDTEDVYILAAYRGSALGTGFATFEDLLTDGLAAGAVVEGSLVGLAHTNALTSGYADIGVATDKAFRRRGFASAAASIVARRIQERGLVPVWSTGEDNEASLRVAARLGFREVSRRVYLNMRPANNCCLR